MTITARSKKDGLNVPPSVRRQAGIKAGDLVEFKVSGSVITILPKVTTARDEYTPAQRRFIDARLAESEEELRKGCGFGPFDTAEEMIASMKRELKKRAQARKVKRVR